MPYLTLQRGTYYFQLRVPRKHQSEFGPLVRVCLGTSDPAAAKVLAMHLAAQWLARFSGLTLPTLGAPPCADTRLNSSDTSLAELGPIPLDRGDAPRPSPASSPLVHSHKFIAVFEYWRDLNPHRPLRTVVEFEACAEAFDRFIQRPVAQVDRRLPLRVWWQATANSKRTGLTRAKPDVLNWPPNCTKRTPPKSVHF